MTYKGKSSRNLSNNDRRAIYQFLLRKSSNGKLKYGSMAYIAKQFETSTRTVRRIWTAGNQTSATEKIPANVDSKKKGNSGRKGRNIADIQSAVQRTPIHKRTTLRSLEASTKIPRSSLHRAKKNGHIFRHSNPVHPLLTEENKIERLRHALSHVSLNPRTDQYNFHRMYNYIHLDEKWFNVYEENQRYYMVPNEKIPHRKVKSKRFIEKVMFLCAVARPRYDYKKKRVFDGKIGVWPFVKQATAQRNLKRRPAGTVETKPLNVDREVYREYILHQVLPAVIKKFPFQRNVPAIIQQDNARPQISVNDPEFLEATANFKNKVELSFQPPNSPDFNGLDLGFFRSLERMQSKLVFHGIDGLIEAVTLLYDTYLSEKISDIFITYQSVLESAMEYLGNNNFKIQHMRKEKISSRDKLTYNHTCSTSTYNKANNHYKGLDN